LGLQCAHQGIFFEDERCPVIHRDIKPSNILIVEDPNLGELVKILDFGIAKLIQASQDQTHSFQGTLAYCSPEQMEGREFDSRSDIYSLGIMMYEMLTGDMPVLPENNSFGSWYQAHRYHPPDPMSPDLGVPKVLEELIMGCLAKTPEERPQKAGDILRVLAPLDHQMSKLGDRASLPSSELNTRSLDELPTHPPPGTKTNSINLDQQNGNSALVRSTWPRSKPVGKIVFPRALDIPGGVLPSLWVMLEKQDLENRIISKRYNQFLFAKTPHPMILWITALYNRGFGVRWLPCYLDLQSRSSLQIVKALGELGYYRILFFALEEPPACQHIMTSTMGTAQRNKLGDWARNAPSWKSTGSPQISKQFLKREFEGLKPKIQAKLQAINTDTPSNFSGAG
ncbi:MAG: serine/threonine-protein kinase, partial [Cyanobacteria bacterium J06641_5]